MPARQIKYMFYGLTAVVAAGLGAASAFVQPAAGEPQAFLRDGNVHLVDTSLGEKQITDDRDTRIVFDQKGNYILYGRGWEGELPESEVMGGTRLRVMSLDGKDDREVAVELVNEAFFDKSGKTIYYVTREKDLYQVPTAGGEPRSYGTKALNVDLSPDGKRLAYLKLNDDWQPGSYLENVPGLAVLDVDSGQEALISDNAFDFAPIWTPNGRSILFYSRSPEGMASMFVMRADGSDRRQLTNVGQAFVSGQTVAMPSEKPVWSPGGRHLAYESDRQIWILEFDETRTNLKSAQPVSYGKSPRWDADGKSLHVLVGKGNDFSSSSLVRIDLTGRVLK